MSKNLIKRSWANFLLRPWLDWPLSLIVLVVLRFAGPSPRADLVLGSLPQPTRVSLYITVAAIAGALLGFFIASVAILLSLFTTSSERLAKVFSGGRAELLVPTFFSAIRTAGLLTAVSLLLLIVDSTASLYIGWVIATLLLVFTMVIRTGRLIWLIWRLTQVAAIDASGPKTKRQVVSDIAQDL